MHFYGHGGAGLDALALYGVGKGRVAWLRRALLLCLMGLPPSLAGTLACGVMPLLALGAMGCSTLVKIRWVWLPPAP